MPGRDIAHIGIMIAGAEAPIEGFKEGLRALGWTLDQNVTLTLRVAKGDADRLPGFAAELVGLGVDLIAVIGAVTARAARAATSSIPIVFAVVVEPIGDGLATSLQHPGVNVTGFTSFDPDQARTQLVFLQQIKPGLSRIGILSDFGVSTCLSDANRDAAHALGLRPQVIRLKGPGPDYDSAFVAFAREGAEALVVLEEPINSANSKHIAALAAAHHLPTVMPISFSDAGTVIAYGTSLREAAKCMAPYVDKILKGAKPGDLPIEAPLHHELIIDLDIARTLGVTVPPELVARASRVIG